MSMTATDVLECLHARYPDDRYCKVVEAPLDAGRQGCKMDLVAIGLRASLKYEIDAIEVKVSLGDFRREIERRTWVVLDADGTIVTHPPTRCRGDEIVEHSTHLDEPDQFTTTDEDGTTHTGYRYNCARVWTRDGGHPRPWRVERIVETDTGKSAPWRAVAHRFWVATPVPLASKIMGLMPDGWGLLACEGGASRVVVRPTKLTPRAPTWRECIGLIRASADAGTMVRVREFDKGARAAYDHAQIAESLRDPWLPGRPL